MNTSGLGSTYCNIPQQSIYTLNTMADKQRVAFVTGAGSGFGAGIARKFAKDGVAVVVADIVSL